MAPKKVLKTCIILNSVLLAPGTDDRVVLKNLNQGERSNMLYQTYIYKEKERQLINE